MKTSTHRCLIALSDLYKSGSEQNYSWLRGPADLGACSPSLILAALILST